MLGFPLKESLIVLSAEARSAEVISEKATPLERTPARSIQAKPVEATSVRLAEARSVEIISEKATPVETIPIRSAEATSADAIPAKKILLANYNSPSPLSEKAYKANEAPHPLQNIKVIENIGDSVDLSLNFTNEKGQTVALRSYFNEKPVLMTVIYYNCPSLCNFHLNGLFTGLNDLKWRNYQFVVLSMDHKEAHELAFEKKQSYLKEFAKVKADSIHFLTGSEDQIQLLTESLGFPFYWDEETQQFAHSPVAYSLSPSGVISRYLYGVQFLPQTLKLALLEAGRGKLGNVIDRALLFCYRFNPEENKYTLYAMNIMKAGGGLMVFILILILAPVWIKERKNAV